MENKNICWVSVETSAGMFSNEYAVSLKLLTGEQVSLFADKKLVKKENGKSSLKVTLVNDDATHKRKLVLLPTETLETASRWAEIAG
jgi:hypothetical protein